MIEVAIARQLGECAIDANFTIDHPGITVLFGHSGAGKTSIINMVAGLVTPERGHIRVQGKSLFDSGRHINLPVHKRRLGYVFQDGRLFPHLNVRQNLLYGRARKTPRQGRTSLTDLDSICSLLGIEGLLKRHPGQLSGGEKQRVAIGRALLAQPQLLLMDEPLASLDPGRKDELLPYISRLPGQFGIPILYVTHSIDEILRLADQVVYLHQGKQLYSGTVEEVVNQSNLQKILPASEAGTVLQARVDRVDRHASWCHLLDGNGPVFQLLRTDLASGARLRFRIPADDVILATDRPSGTSIRNSFPGKIIAVEFLQPGQAKVTVDIGQPLLANISQAAWKELQLEIGRDIHVLVKSVIITRTSVVKNGAALDAGTGR